MKKRVHIAYTGGTIGMRPTPGGYAPYPGCLQELLDSLVEFQHPSLPEISLHEYQPLLDSSNILPDDWFRIAQDIAAHYDDYDGFVVLHGTDTMAYTASALAFMLQGLRKPVILTGAQIPLSELRSDGRDNLVTALMIAASYPIPEVCLFFGSRLLRGCRSIKVDADGFDAFASPNYPPLGAAGVEITINWSAVRPAPPPSERLRVERLQAPLVAALRLFPGISARLVDNLLHPPLVGLVLEAYGLGNGPDRDEELLAALRQAAGRGVVVVVCTQCLKGTVNLHDYATGSALAKTGALSGYDMTSEAALTKLFYLFSAGFSPEQVREKMGQDLRGELTPPGLQREL